MTSYKIVNSDIKDLDFACYLFDEAIAYQKRKGYPEYRSNDRTGQETDIKNKQHFKLVVNDEIAAIFRIWNNDKIFGENVI